MLVILIAPALYVMPVPPLSLESTLAFVKYKFVPSGKLVVVVAPTTEVGLSVNTPVLLL